MPPSGDAADVPDEERARQLPWSSGSLDQAQTHFLRQAVSLATVHLLAGQDAILSLRLTATRAREDVIDVALVSAECLASVLATTSVPCPDGSSVKGRAAFRHLGKAAEHNDMRNAHGTAWRAHSIVVLPHRQLDPLRPAHGHHVVAIDVQGGRHVGRHLYKRLLRRAHIDGLPVAVKHQHNRSVEYVVHSSFSSVDS
jgi:hypothetical protein